jgi:transcriptional regulator GlxA family with amidase domain
MESLIAIEDVWQAPALGMAFAPLKLTGDETVDLFSAYIREAHVRSVEDYAKWMNLKPIDLNVLIRHSTGMTPSEWIRRLVVCDAQGIMLCTDEPLEEVAKLLHFKSLSALTNYFKRNRKQTPSAYRRTHRKTEMVKKVNINW